MIRLLTLWLLLAVVLGSDPSDVSEPSPSTHPDGPRPAASLSSIPRAKSEGTIPSLLDTKRFASDSALLTRKREDPHDQREGVFSDDSSSQDEPLYPSVHVGLQANRRRRQQAPNQTTRKLSSEQASRLFSSPGSSPGSSPTGQRRKGHTVSSSLSTSPPTPAKRPGHHQVSGSAGGTGGLFRNLRRAWSRDQPQSSSEPRVQWQDNIAESPRATTPTTLSSAADREGHDDCEDDHGDDRKESLKRRSSGRLASEPVSSPRSVSARSSGRGSPRDPTASSISSVHETSSSSTTSSRVSPRDPRSGSSVLRISPREIAARLIQVKQQETEETVDREREPGEDGSTDHIPRSPLGGSSRRSSSSGKRSGGRRFSGRGHATTVSSSGHSDTEDEQSLFGHGPPRKSNSNGGDHGCKRSNSSGARSGKSRGKGDGPLDGSEPPHGNGGGGPVGSGGRRRKSSPRPLNQRIYRPPKSLEVGDKRGDKSNSKPVQILLDDSGLTTSAHYMLLYGVRDPHKSQISIHAVHFTRVTVHDKQRAALAETAKWPRYLEVPDEWFEFAPMQDFLSNQEIDLVFRPYRIPPVPSFESRVDEWEQIGFAIVNVSGVSIGDPVDSMRPLDPSTVPASATPSILVGAAPGSDSANTGSVSAVQGGKSDTDTTDSAITAVGRQTVPSFLLSSPPHSLPGSLSSSRSGAGLGPDTASMSSSCSGAGLGSGTVSMSSSLPGKTLASGSSTTSMSSSSPSTVSGSSTLSDSASSGTVSGSGAASMSNSTSGAGSATSLPKPLSSLTLDSLLSKGACQLHLRNGITLYLRVPQRRGPNNETLVRISPWSQKWIRKGPPGKDGRCITNVARLKPDHCWLGGADYGLLFAESLMLLSEPDTPHS